MSAVNLLSALRVITSEHADLRPSDGENARRLVRHLYAEAGVLEWLGEKPGPLPGEVIRNVFLLPDGGVIMSPRTVAVLRDVTV